MYYRRWAGFTLGWTIFYWTACYKMPDTMRHERQHVRQALFWGIFLPIAYLAVLPFTGYENNPFEKQARGKEQ